MAEVVVDGQRYVPAGVGAPSVGVAVTTRDRRSVFDRSVAEWRRRLPEGARLVIVDDASESPAPGADFRFVEQAGIAAAKNKCIEMLNGCSDIFLVDDDCWPIVDDWWRPYVESPEPHLMLCWGDKVYDDGTLTGYAHPNGCMLYLHRSAVDRVGGMDTSFRRHEHVNLSDRIFNAGLTTVRYGDVPGSDKLFKALDRDHEVASTIPEEDARTVGFKQLLDGRWSDKFCDYREHPGDSGFALSVLVASVSSRRDSFAPRIAGQLFGQWEALPDWQQARCEVLMLTDTMSMSLGAKRDRMIGMARGRYIAFVDDDDRVAEDYLATLLSATESGADVLTFDVDVSMNGAAPKPCRYSLSYDGNSNAAGEYHRLPNHIMAVRRSIAAQVGFSDVTFGEDSDYAQRLRPLLHSERHVDKTLYFYDFSDATTEGQRSWQDEVTRSILPPRADVIILSKASTPELEAMCQHTVDTCRATTGTTKAGDILNVNIIVLEQVPGIRYRGATTIYSPGEFWYNRSMNDGARRGMAPWIVFANSDLEFQPGWLATLLEADHDLVSPGNPGYQRQKDITGNTLGTVNGKHFCGWCFMMKRSLWEKIGGLDPDFRFWAADDSVIEQAKAAGAKPMIVPAAQVKHLTSKTIGGAQDDPDGELTWAMVRIFEDKYGVKKFENDRRYAEWKSRNPR